MQTVRPRQIAPLITTLLTLACVACPRAHAQTYVNVEEQNPALAFIINIALDIPTTYDVANYKVTYRTVDALGRPDTASGLLSIPMAEDTEFPMAAYMHGTAVDREAVPSNPPTEERFLVYALATTGYITVAPDYIGLGESEGFHPYVHAASESRSGRDLLLAARQWLDEQGIPYNDQLFVTGYSQGGHAAQALHRDLATDPENDSLVVTAGAHLSGPYSISGVMREATLTLERPTFPGFIVYTYVSYNNVYGLYEDLDEAFVPPYLGVIDSFDRELLDGEQFNIRLDTLLKLRDERLVDLFTEPVRTAIAENNPDDPIIQALNDNDTYRWAPSAPTLLYYCTEDEQVPFRNAIIADSVMRELGSTSVLLESGGALDHGECIRPAVTRALELFESLAQRSPVSNRQTAGELSDFGVYPNPTRAGSEVRLRGLPEDDLTLRLYDSAGRSLLETGLRLDRTVLLPADVPPGLYFLRLTDMAGRQTTRKLVIR